MGFIFDPAHKLEAQKRLGSLMRDVKNSLAGGVPFAIEPVVYDFQINEAGTTAELLAGNSAILPDGYYNLILPTVLRKDQRSLTAGERSDLARFSLSCHGETGRAGRMQNFLDRLLPQGQEGNGHEDTLESLLSQNGFDPDQHERIQSALRAGRIGLAQNRLPPSTLIQDVSPEDVFDARRSVEDKQKYRRRSARLRRSRGRHACRRGRKPLDYGAGVVKALSPFCRLAGRHRAFLEVHLAKSTRTGRMFGS